MNPNSTHQLWSRWTTTARVPFRPWHVSTLFEHELRTATARQYRQWFGSATELQITQRKDGRETVITVACRTEGCPANEPAFRQRRMTSIANYFGQNLRRSGQVKVHIDVHIEAGDEGIGKPPAQLVMAPPIVDEPFLAALRAQRQALPGLVAPLLTS